MKTPTIYDIKRQTAETAPYFFNRQSMKFFNQTLKDFIVKQSPTGRIFIYAKSIISYNILHFTIREYADGKLLSVPGNFDYIDDILNYIKEN